MVARDPGRLKVYLQPRALRKPIEKEFAKFLQDAEDVSRFAKLPEQFRFVIEYTDAAGNLRYYEPDFVAVTEEGIHHLIETKGSEDVNVSYKDRAASLWCENATTLTGMMWCYVKVRQKDYNSLQPRLFADLDVLSTAERPVAAK